MQLYISIHFVWWFLFVFEAQIKMEKNQLDLSSSTTTTKQSILLFWIVHKFVAFRIFIEEKSICWRQFIGFFFLSKIHCMCTYLLFMLWIIYKSMTKTSQSFNFNFGKSIKEIIFEWSQLFECNIEINHSFTWFIQWKKLQCDGKVKSQLNNNNNKIQVNMCERTKKAPTYKWAVLVSYQIWFG